MKTATCQDKALVVSILSRSFKDNKSVNYILPQDRKLPARLQALMDYSFEACMASGTVLLSDNATACALLKIPGKPPRPLHQLWLDLRLIWTAIGLKGLGKVLRHESILGRIRGKERMCYLWFIGVQPEHQHQGHGSRLLKEILAYCKSLDAPLYLETSTEENLAWYKGFGFECYHILDSTYPLYFFRQTL